MQPEQGCDSGDGSRMLPCDLLVEKQLAKRVAWIEQWMADSEYVAYDVHRRLRNQPGDGGDPEQGFVPTPDPRDVGLSKRQWNKATHAWKRAIRDYNEAAAADLGPPGPFVRVRGTSVGAGSCQHVKCHDEQLQP